MMVREHPGQVFCKDPIPFSSREKKKIFPCGSTETWVECYLFVYSASVVYVLRVVAWGCNV